MVSRYRAVICFYTPNMASPSNRLTTKVLLLSGAANPNGAVAVFVSVVGVAVVVAAWGWRAKEDRVLPSQFVVAVLWCRLLLFPCWVVARWWSAPRAAALMSDRTLARQWRTCVVPIETACGARTFPPGWPIRRRWPSTRTWPTRLAQSFAKKD